MPKWSCGTTGYGTRNGAGGGISNRGGSSNGRQGCWRRSYFGQSGELKSTQIFVRDRFIDRYSGDRLVFPPVLRVLSFCLGNEFPYHPNWKTDATHPAYWELGATIDHITPVSLGGTDEDSNLLTTSMAHNQAKLNSRPEDLGWKIRAVGDMKSWDGLIKCFLAYCRAEPSVLGSDSMKRWHKAAERVMGTARENTETLRR